MLHYALLLCFITTVPSSASELAETTNETLCNQNQSNPEQQELITAINEVNEQVTSPGACVEIDAPAVRTSILIPIAIVGCIVVIIACCGLIIYIKLRRSSNSAKCSKHRSVKEGIQNNAHSTDAIWFTKINKQNTPDLEADSTSPCFLDKLNVKYVTSNSLQSKNEAPMNSSASKLPVQEIESTNTSMELFNNSLRNITGEQTSSQKDRHLSVVEPRSDSMWVSALVENNNGLRMVIPERKNTQIMTSIRSEENLSRSVSPKSFQSNYSFSTASYSSVVFFENESGKSSACASPEASTKSNEKLQQSGQRTLENCGIEAPSIQDSTNINPTQTTVIGIDDVPYPEELNRARTPLPVEIARNDKALRNIGRIRSVHNDEDQNSERPISVQSDYSFSTASLRSDDSTFSGPGINSSRSNLSNDSGIPSSCFDVEVIYE